MSLSEIQFKEALRKASLAVLRSGKVPSLSRVIRETQKRLPESVIAPTMKVRPQDRRVGWNLRGTNDMMEEVQFDLEVLYKSLLEQSDKVLRRLNLVETSTRSQHAQMDRIEGVVRNLLFIIQDGDGHFNAFFDDFHDFSKVDLEKTTRDTIDLLSQTVELPDASPNTRKINLEHLHNANAWIYDTNADSKILKAETPSDAPFKNMFLDTVSMWRHDVVTAEAGPTSVSFTIPVHPVRGGELSISRVQMIGVSEFKQRVEVLYSVDGINYLNFPNSESAVELEKSSSAVNLDFPRTRVEFLKITIFRSNHDKVTDTGYLTSFGLRHLALYTIGRSFQSKVVSKPFQIPESEVVEKLSLSVYEEVPEGTDIKYYLAAVERETTDDDQATTDGQWVPVTPITRTKKKDEATRKLTIGTLSNKTLQFIPKTPLTPVLNFKGTEYYQVNGATDTALETLVTDSIVFGTASLQRGSNAWLRKKGGEATLFRVEGNFISFSSGPRQKLYTTASETVGFSSVLNWDGIERSTIEISRPIDYRPSSGMSVRPPDGVDPYSVPDPLHAVYEVTLTAQSTDQTELVTFPTTSGAKVKFASAPIDIKESQETLEYLSAYRPNLGTHDDELIEALEARPGLSDYQGNTIKSMVSLSTPDDVAAGKPQLTRFTVGNHDSAAVVQNRTVDGEVVASVPTPAPSQRGLDELSDQQILDLFGRVKFRTKFVHGITGESLTDPSIVYTPGKHFQLDLIPDPTTGIEELYVSIPPTDASIPVTQRINAGDTVKFKFKYKKNLTPHVMAVSGNRIYLDRKFADFTNVDSGYRVKVGYRFVPVGTNQVLKDSLVVTSEPGGTPFVSGRDYHFNPKDGTITQIPSGRIGSNEGKTAVYASFTHKGALNALETFSIWAFVSSRDPIKISYPRLEVDSEFGEKILISTGAGSLVDISNTTETPELEHGWHQVLVYSRDPDIFVGTAIRKVAELLDLEDQPVFLAGGDYFSTLEGTRVPMTQVPRDFLLNSVLPTDRSKFAIDSTGRVLVNFQPNSQADFYTYGYRSTDDGSGLKDTVQYYDETFTLKYAYHREEARTISAVLFKAVLSRSKDVDDSVTPKLGGYQIRVG